MRVFPVVHLSVANVQGSGGIWSPWNGKGACNFTFAQYRRRNSNMAVYYKYSSFHIWIFVMKQETFSIVNHVNGLIARAREAEREVRSGVLLRVRVV